MSIELLLQPWSHGVQPSLSHNAEFRKLEKSLDNMRRLKSTYVHLILIKNCFETTCDCEMQKSLHGPKNSNPLQPVSQERCDMPCHWLSAAPHHIELLGWSSTHNAQHTSLHCSWMREKMQPLSRVPGRVQLVMMARRLRCVDSKGFCLFLTSLFRPPV